MNNNSSEMIVLSQFSKTVLDQASIAAKLKPSSLLSKRLDLRGKTVLSFIDTLSARAEHAFSLYRVGNVWKLGIHVADVAEYVCEGSPLDAEAERRLASIKYGFVNSDMLPEKLTKEICNLATGGDKLCVSVLLDIDEKGKLLSIQFEESVVRVAQACVYKEIDELCFAADTSSVIRLRDKYAALQGTITDMYELAAIFCNLRRAKGGLDCEVFRRIYNRDESGRVIGFRREREPDTRAMVREIGYYVSEAIGTELYRQKMPCIFVGTEPVRQEVLDYLGTVVGEHKMRVTPAERTANLADRAKGTPYYSFVCDAISNGLPCAEYSEKPIFSTFCGCDKIVSFINPASRYSDLLTQRMLKTSIAAKGDSKNLNLSKYRKILAKAAENANKASKFAYDTAKKFSRVASLEYLEHSEDKIFPGFVMIELEDKGLRINLECGAPAYVTPEAAEGFNYTVGRLYKFELVSLGSDYEPTVVKPIIE